MQDVKEKVCIGGIKGQRTSFGISFFVFCVSGQKSTPAWLYKFTVFLPRNVFVPHFSKEFDPQYEITIFSLFEIAPFPNSVKFD